MMVSEHFFGLPQATDTGSANKGAVEDVAAILSVTEQRIPERF